MLYLEYKNRSIKAGTWYDEDGKGRAWNTQVIYCHMHTTSTRILAHRVQLQMASPPPGMIFAGRRANNLSSFHAVL